MIETEKQESLAGHGGLLFPLDMFRPTMLASVVAEAMVAKLRNVLDAQIELTRHPATQLVLMRIQGNVIDGQPGEFWRENMDLGLVFSQVLPRQVFAYYVIDGEAERQGFLVAQKGQALAADDATPDQLPPDATPADWPVARLAEQLGTTMEELESGFEGGPRITVAVVEPTGDDRELLMTLAGQPPDGADEYEGADGHAAPEAHAGAVEATGPAHAPAPRGPASSVDGPPPASAPRKSAAQDDIKRRADERVEEQRLREELARDVQGELPLVMDELGAVVAPRAELGDADILSEYVVARVGGDLPAGLDLALQSKLAGKRIDIAVKVDFLSEVFFGEGPLDKATFEANARDGSIGGRAVKVIEVLAPRLGRGTLIREGRAGVFVSRTEALPEDMIAALLDAGS